MGMIIDQEKCILCKRCIEACPYNALHIKEDKLIVDENKCTLCGICIDSCPCDALEIKQLKTKTINKCNWKDILVYVADNEEGILEVTYELIGEALRLAMPLNYKVYCVYIGYKIAKKAEELKAYDVETVFVYDSEKYKNYKVDLYAEVCNDVIDRLHPSIVLIGGTDQGKSLAPILATRYKTGLTADCTSFEIKDNSDLVQIRPAFGGSLMAQIVTENHRPQFATVRPKVMEKAKKNINQNENIQLCHISKINKSTINVLSCEKVVISKSIQEARKIVVVGQGFKEKEDIELAKKLAELLGAEIGSTRSLVEKGWMPANRQIGLTGKTVSPDLLIAIGVSGSVQLMAGMQNSHKIVAINNDKDASILGIAHYPILGDLYEILPNLISKLEGSMKEHSCQ